MNHGDINSRLPQALWFDLFIWVRGLELILFTFQSFVLLLSLSHSFNPLFSFQNLFLLHPCSLQQHIFSFCCLAASFLQPGSCLILLMCLFPHFFLHTSHPNLYLPSSNDFNYCFLPEAVSLSLLSLLYNVSHCLFFFLHPFFFIPNWILLVALLQLYNKAYILGFTLSTRLPSLQIFLFCRFDHMPFISQNTVSHHFIYKHNCRLTHRLWMRYVRKIGTLQVCRKMAFQASRTASGLGNVSLS